MIVSNISGLNNNENFRCIIGRNKFYWTNRYPRILFLVGVKEFIENYEGYAYCAYEAYQNRTGQELEYPRDIEYPNPGSAFRASILLYPELALFENHVPVQKSPSVIVLADNHWMFINNAYAKPTTFIPAACRCSLFQRRVHVSVASVR